MDEPVPQVTRYDVYLDEHYMCTTRVVIEADYLALQRQLAAAIERAEEAERLNFSVVGKNEDLTQQLANTQRRVDELKVEYERWYHKALDLQEQLAALREQVANYQQTIQDYTDNHSDCGKQLATLTAQYHELLYAVARKWPNETRHQTALRYIKEVESHEDGAAQAAEPPQEGG